MRFSTGSSSKSFAASGGDIALQGNGERFGMPQEVIDTAMRRTRALSQRVGEIRLRAGNPVVASAPPLQAPEQVGH
eukprot:11183726-Lingulodinium_polyedra.AAC.1